MIGNPKIKSGKNTGVDKMTYKQELAKGKKVEREHRHTFAVLQKKKLSANKFYESIARDHLKEDKEYYTKLKKAKL
jgi:hypothetical protein